MRQVKVSLSVVDEAVIRRGMEIERIASMSEFMRFAAVAYGSFLERDQAMHSDRPIVVDCLVVEGAR